jgi:hypothetical protein
MAENERREQMERDAWLNTVYVQRSANHPKSPFSEGTRIHSPRVSKELENAFIAYM